MNKPTTLLIEEFKQNMAEVINNSKLPAFILEYLIKDIHEEVEKLAESIKRKEISEYMESINEDSEEQAEVPALS